MVAGAPAQVAPEVAGRLVPGEGRPVLVEQVLGAHDDAGRAEAALQRPGGGECAGQAVALGRLDALERGDRPARHPVEPQLAGDHGLAVDEHGAAAALSRRRAAVLGAGDVELLPQRREQVGVVADLDLAAVEGEGHRHGSRVPEFNKLLKGNRVSVYAEGATEPVSVSRCGVTPCYPRRQLARSG